MMLCSFLLLMFCASGYAQSDRSSARDEANAPVLEGAIKQPIPAGDGSQSHIESTAQLLFDNGPLVTHPGGGFGGADASALQNTMLNVYGFNQNAAANYRIADDFVVSGGAWTIDSIAFFGYQTGSTTTSTFTSVRLEIWNGRPDSVGSSVVFGDLTTNRMISTRFSNIYRVLITDLTATNRPIMRNVASVGTTLQPGTYWLVWNATGSLTSGPWQPPVTILGTYTTGNAMQYTGTAWQAIRDSIAPNPGNPQGVPFLIYGIASSPPLNPFNLLTPAAGVTITTLPGSSTPVSFTWDTSTATATYKWVFGSPVVPPRLFTLSSSTNSLTTTLGALDAMLAGAGVAQGDSLVGQWDVWAYRNNPPANDSLSSANGPRALTLKRALPPLTAFNLVSPATDTTIVTSAFVTSPISFRWRSAGAGATYRWKFASPAFPDTVRLNVTAALDTSITFRSSQLDSLIAGLGIAPGDSIVGQWRVYAYSGSDSLASSQTRGVIFRRAALPPCLSDFRVTRTTGITYVSIATTGNSFAAWRNGTSIDDNRSAATPIGFTFNYLGVDYTSFSASTNGYLDFSSSTATGAGTGAYGYQNTQFTATTGTLLALGPLYDDLIFPSGTPQANVMKYQVDGTAPDRVLTVEWIGVRQFASSTTGSMNFQVKLYETSNKIEFIYGPMDPGTATPSYTLGLNAATMSSTPTICELLTQQTPNSATFSNVPQNALTVVPESNSKLTFELPVVSVEPVSGILPEGFSLEQNYPNPFNPTTTIRFSMPHPGHVTIKVFDVLGRELAKLVDGFHLPGFYDVSWDASSFASGVYFYRMQAGTFSQVRKLMILK